MNKKIQYMLKPDGKINLYMCICVCVCVCDLKFISPLLAGFGRLALEGAHSPLLEFGGRLLIGGSCNGYVCHSDQLLKENKRQLNT